MPKKKIKYAYKMRPSDPRVLKEFQDLIDRGKREMKRIKGNELWRLDTLEDVPIKKM